MRSDKAKVVSPVPDSSLGLGRSEVAWLEGLRRDMGEGAIGSKLMIDLLGPSMPWSHGPARVQSFTPSSRRPPALVPSPPRSQPAPSSTHLCLVS